MFPERMTRFVLRDELAPEYEGDRIGVLGHRLPDSVGGRDHSRYGRRLAAKDGAEPVLRNVDFGQPDHSLVSMPLLGPQLGSQVRRIVRAVVDEGGKGPDRSAGGRQPNDGPGRAGAPAS